MKLKNFITEGFILAGSVIAIDAVILRVIDLISYSELEITALIGVGLLIAAFAID